jgi:hypothetical protein
LLRVLDAIGSGHSSKIFQKIEKRQPVANLSSTRRHLRHGSHHEEETTSEQRPGRVRRQILVVVAARGENAVAELDAARRLPGVLKTNDFSVLPGVNEGVNVTTTQQTRMKARNDT